MMDSADNPWCWIHVFLIIPRNFEADHAGEQETSMLWTLRPGLVPREKLADSKDWFTESAVNATPEQGEAQLEDVLAWWENYLDMGSITTEKDKGVSYAN